MSQLNVKFEKNTMLRVLSHFPRVVIGLGHTKYNFCPTKMAQVRYNANDKR